MENISILWADDEIDLLKPHILFLEQKGYEVVTTNNGDEAMDIIRERNFDIVFLDEHMPGMSGIETLEGIMKARPGDWIIKGVKGEFYPCKPDIFEMTYEVVHEGKKE